MGWFWRNHARAVDHGGRIRRLRRRLTRYFGPDSLSRCCPGSCRRDLSTFLPSFLFILAGGPLGEATHGNPATAPLTAITAAVSVSVASLALFFLAHIALVPASALPAAP
jgi:hypothetical protein